MFGTTCRWNFISYCFPASAAVLTWSGFWWASCRYSLSVSTCLYIVILSFTVVDWHMWNLAQPSLHFMPQVLLSTCLLFLNAGIKVCTHTPDFWEIFRQIIKVEVVSFFLRTYLENIVVSLCLFVFHAFHPSCLWLLL